jgi:molybdopterin-containing oxidoreductase family iron-sulfur binding subunit
VALFTPRANAIYRGAALALGAGLITLICAPMIYIRTPYAGGVNDPVTQPIEFDHRHHVRDDGIDCVYCHDTVETEAYAGLPSTERCMGCHGQVWPDSPETAPLRASWESHTPIRWKRINALPSHVYFHHGVHVQAGVACARCHGEIQDMPRDHAPHHLHHVSPMKDDGLLSLLPRVEVTRRDALKLLATGVAALEASCLEKPGERELVPYLVEPPEQRAGVAVRCASALTLDGFGVGVIVDTHDGRPTKLDGNPAHPAVLGGSLPWLQARILDLYDPQRSRVAQLRGQDVSWPQLVKLLGGLPRGPLWLVMPPQPSPTIAALLARVAQRQDLRVCYHAPLARTNVYRGAELAYGRPLEVRPDLSRADVIAALDSDFLACGPMSAAMSRAFAARRAPGDRMNRLWVAEPMQTPTGTVADERLAFPARDVPAIAIVVARAAGVALPDATVRAAEARLGARVAWARRLAADLARARGAGAVIVGERQPPVVHALARVIDHALGNPVVVTPPALLDPLGGAPLEQLARERDPGTVIVLDCDPVYTAPHMNLGAALARATLSLHVGLYRNATSEACAGHMPLAHDLETWTDPRAADGTLAIGQPAIRERFEVASIINVLAALAGDRNDARTLVHDQLRAGAPLDAFDATWTAALRSGVVAGSAAQPVTAQPAWRSGDELAALLAPPAGTEIALAPSPSLYDGRFAPNAWLQELPHPITKQTWGNAALMSEATARALGVGNEDLVRVTTRAAAVTLPALIVTGAADGSITIELGHGQRAPAIAAGIGTDAYPLGDFIISGSVTRAGGRRRIPRTQLETEREGRDIAPVVTLAKLRAELPKLAELRGPQPSLLPERHWTGVQWGISIDTSICTGCSACVVACVAENNIPTVGPDDVARGRAMHWLRIDRYVDDAARVVNEPMLCQHCEQAPCEYVCPVNATDHSPDGLNEQVYNRCIGTRFCQNNCPYKVRRFNWFSYEKDNDRALQYNPDVTVRSRGVMEKCTYCVQRIRGAEHRALVEKRAIAPGEVVTACQAACPTGAIQFGQLAEQGTPFAAMRRDARRFEALHDLGTHPRTQYLAKVTNPKEGA